MSQGLGLCTGKQRTCQSSNVLTSGLLGAAAGAWASAGPLIRTAPSTVAAAAQFPSNSFIERLHKLRATGCRYGLATGAGALDALALASLTISSWASEKPLSDKGRL